MTKIIFSLTLILCSIQIFAFEVSSEALKASHLPQLSHEGPGPFDTYLTMNLPFSPYSELRKQIEKKTGALKHRGEAHITVITPIEYFQVLKPIGVTIQEINEIARKQKIQNSRFRLVCVGLGKFQNFETYYVVIESDDLLRIREEIASLYRQKGGKEAFDPTQYYSHVTLGFSERDLHESDGVIKDRDSCLDDGKIEIVRK